MQIVKILKKSINSTFQLQQKILKLKSFTKNAKIKYLLLNNKLVVEYAKIIKSYLNTHF